MTEETISMFVYGLLRPGLSLYHVLEPYVLDVAENAHVRGFRMYAGSYPIAIRGGLSDIIWGALLEVKNDEALIREIDGIESGYNRERVKVETPEGEREVWMYVWPGEPWGEAVEDGDFVSRRRRRG